MKLIRAFEIDSERSYFANKIGGYCHLSVGQEATTVGTTAALTSTDMLVTSYRCHGFALARGIPAKNVMAELYGKTDGCSGGKGGSMHLADIGKNYFGGWGIVAGQLPIATGIALAGKRQAERQGTPPPVVLCEMGEGATNMGAWHESLNMAALWNLPILYLVINNHYGMGTSVERASAEPEIWKKAAAYKMNAERIDGDNLETVYKTTSDLLVAAQEGRPAVLETMTYRFKGHSIADAGTGYRSKEEIDEQTAHHDPIKIEEAKLLEIGLEKDVILEMDKRVEEEMKSALDFAAESPRPPMSDLAYSVHAPGSKKQFSAMAKGQGLGNQVIQDGLS